MCWKYVGVNYVKIEGSNVGLIVGILGSIS